MKKLITFLTLLTLFFTTAWGEEVTLTKINLQLTATPTSNTEHTVDGIIYVSTDLKLDAGAIYAKGYTGTIRNKTAFPGNITSVAIIYSGNSPRVTTIWGSSDGNEWDEVAINTTIPTTDEHTFTVDFEGKNYKFFKITRGASTAYWTRIEITYTVGGGDAGDIEEYVDLGLPSGTLWATKNIGASCPEEYGQYFAWGETTPKNVYDWDTYQWSGNVWNTMTKYCTSDIYGKVDDKTELDPEDDAATANWGQQWCMPTKDQQDELLAQCTWEWTTRNGMKGYLVTSKKNSNWLFLPAAGYHDGAELYSTDKICDYWSSTLNTEESNQAYDIWCYWYSESSSGTATNSNARYFGFPVRAVRATEWVLTTPSELKTGDVVLIVDKNSKRAMTNNNGTSSAPSATSVKLNTDLSKVIGGVTTALQWDVTNTNGTFNFTVPGTSNYLYTNNSNDGVRVGTSSNKNFIIKDNFLYNTATSRYLGVYNNQEWRCYTSSGVNIANTQVAFYKKVDIGAHSVAIGTITGEGTITLSTTSANSGDVITITATPNSGYTLSALSYNDNAIALVEGQTEYTFTMPDEDVTVNATFNANSYNITVVSLNGTTTCPSIATTGQNVSFTVTPNEGYIVNTVTASFVNNNGGTTAVTINEENGTYSFGMPPYPVTVTVTYKEPFTSKQYKLITSNDDLEAGVTYLIANGTNATAVMGHYDSSNMRGLKVNVTPVNGIITSTEEMEVITLGGETGLWQLITASGNLGAASTSNGKLAYNTEQTATISIADDGEATILFSHSSYLPMLCFNNNFVGCYGTNTSVSKVYLFKEIAADAIATPTFDPESGVYTEGENVTVTISCATEGVTIYYTIDGTTPDEESSKYTNQIEVTSNTTIKAIAIKDDKSSDVAVATYNFVKPGAAFVLVTSEDDLFEGGEYIIVSSDHTKVMSAISTNKKALSTTDFSISADYQKINAGDEVNILTLGKEDDAWTFMQENEKYIYLQNDNTDIIEESKSGYSKLLTINILDNNYAKITNTSTTYNQIIYSPPFDYFGHYKSSNLSQQNQTAYQNVLLYYRGTPNKTLAEIETLGAKAQDKTYTIKDKLLAVHADVDRGLLWCKDDNASIFPTHKKGSQIDYMLDVVNEQQTEWDQSNWVALQFSEPTSEEDPIYIMLKNAEGKYIKAGTITGTVSDASNFTFTIAKDELVFDGTPENEFKPNVYCTANFLPQNLNLTEESEGAAGIYNGEPAHYFFVNPKVQEYCVITYAVWDGNNTFIAPSPSSEHPNHNDGLIDGAFTVAWKYNSTGENNLPELEVGAAYRFEAIVSRTPNSSYLNAIIGDPSDQIIVYPANLDPVNNEEQVITAISTVECGNGEVKSVKYVNVAGIVSDRPFEGVNIVVTEYTDGSRTTSKMLKK